MQQRSDGEHSALRSTTRRGSKSLRVLVVRNTPTHASNVNGLCGLLVVVGVTYGADSVILGCLGESAAGSSLPLSVERDVVFSGRRSARGERSSS